VASESRDNQFTMESEVVSKRELEKVLKDFEKTKDEIQGLRKDFITVCGLFASLVTFLSIEVQIFRTVSRFSLVAGISFSSFRLS
jgi:hypothetical protein